MHSRDVSTRSGSSAILSLTAAAAIAAGLSLPLFARRSAGEAGSPIQSAQPAAAPGLHELSARANVAIGLLASEVIELDIDPEPARSLAIRVPIDGVEQTLELLPHSVRADGYELLLQVEGGELVSVEPGPVRTVRGALRDVPGSIAAGGTSDEGLTAIITMPDGERLAIEPLAGRVAGAAPKHHALYRVADAIPAGGTCGNALELAPEDAPEAAQNGGGAGVLDALYCAEIACDADRDYFLDWNASVNAVENRINLVINTVNIQYESQLLITHVITTVIIRTVEPDPYDETQSDALLCQFIEEWTDNLQSIPFDVAKLFTGKDIQGSVIGQAANFGEICDRVGSCGPGLDDGGYCHSQNDCCGAFACATDLAAHELGHLWDAVHCTCPGFTMHPSIQCANAFTQDTVAQILNFRNSINCLVLNCETGSGIGNDTCADADVIASTTNLTISNEQATPAQNDGGPGDPDLPSGSPSCQWQNPSVPTNVHNTLWFRFTAADTSVEIETCTSSDVDESIIALYEGTCGDLTELACSENTCGSTGKLSRICYLGLVPGEPYYVMVGNPGGWSGSDPGNIEFEVTTPCPQIGPQAGACCNEGWCVFLVSEPECAATGGQFQGAGTTCGPNPCPQPTGACCFGDGACIQLTSIGCLSSGGDFAGNHTVCAPNPCPQPGGACCLTGGECQLRTSVECASLGGAYEGDGVACSPNPCPTILGACCLSQCLDLTSFDCGFLGGSYLGDGTVCTVGVCDVPVGACCFTGACIVLDAPECSANGGAHQGSGTDCTPNPCAQPTGACCFANGSCNVQTSSACGGAGGTYQGNGTGCGPNPCPQPTGACCFGDGSCTIVTSSACGIAGGAHQADGVACKAAACPRPCPYDLDQSTDVGFGDLTALLLVWGPCAPCPEDFDHDGAVGFGDLTSMLLGWGPCP